MNVDHFGMVFSIALILVVLALVFLITHGINILPETSYTAPNSDFSDYCQKLNLKC